MNAFRSALLLWMLCSVFLPAFSLAENTQTESRAWLDMIISNLNQADVKQLPDKLFKFNPGFDGAKRVAEAMGLEDYTPEKYFEQNRLHPEERKFNQLYEEKASSRREYLENVDKKNRAFSEAEKKFSAQEQSATRKLEHIEQQTKAKNGYQSKRQQRKFRQQTRILNEARAGKASVRAQRADLQRAKRLENYTKLRNKIQTSGSKITRMRDSLRFKGKVDNGLFWTKVALTGLSAEAEENYRAQQEGRQPLAINKLIIFTKGMTGYAAVEGLVMSTQVSRHEAMKQAAEYYKDLDLEDVSIEELEKRVIGFANRAAARTAIYEGAKLLPVVGDAINTKEIFDAGFEARVAVEEANYTILNNVETQFQTSLRAAVNLDAKVRQMEKIAEQAKLLTASLTNIKGQLLSMEQTASSNRDRVKQALNILESYNEQTQALQNPAVDSSLGADSTDAMLARLKAIKSSADEQIGNMQRVKSEHASGELSPQGVATQAKFIADLLQPSISDYTTLQPALNNIEAISKGTSVAAQVPQALEILNQAKPIMQKNGQLAATLYETYKDQAGVLEQMAKQFKELRGEMTSNLAHLQKSKNLEEQHRDKMRAALDRANNTALDQTAIRRVIDDVRGLRYSSEMVSALASLDKIPETADDSQIDSLIQKAQQAWGKLSGPYLAATESLQKTKSLLNELMELSGNIEPTNTSKKDLLEPEPEKPELSRGSFDCNQLTVTSNIDFSRWSCCSNQFEREKARAMCLDGVGQMRSKTVTYKQRIIDVIRTQEGDSFNPQAEYSDYPTPYGTLREVDQCSNRKVDDFCRKVGAPRSERDDEKRDDDDSKNKTNACYEKKRQLIENARKSNSDGDDGVVLIYASKSCEEAHKKCKDRGYKIGEACRAKARNLQEIKACNPKVSEYWENCALQEVNCSAAAIRQECGVKE